MTTTYYLGQTVTSSFKKGYVYGEAGTEVKVISDTIDVAIVEDKKGNRYPVHKDKLITKTK